MLIPILFAFTEAAVSLLGLHSQFFNNFGDAFITVLMFGFGQVNGSVFVGSKASTLIVIFFALFYFFVTFFLVTVFAGIYIDSYRVTIMDYGYHFIDKNKWTYKGKGVIKEWCLIYVIRIIDVVGSKVRV